ncbi:uncharacterized protein LOC123878808 [Maniola jurtina]|uniref:uncharacterized protein LOC123878808 n=1 Tax=Maniola jurtina TaxID=191418 RepID=UPI001E689601|nr:uncharacterized protein LOC123878808 [Maniola jurtina]
MKMDENGTTSTMEEKCEYLMNIVVESRKQYGKMCIDYDQKKSVVENKMLKLQLNNITSCRFKAKNIPQVNTDGMKKDVEDFTNEISLSQRRLNDLSNNVKDMQSIVLQLKNDTVGQKLKKKITADALLAEAKRKNNK